MQLARLRSAALDAANAVEIHDQAAVHTGKLCRGKERGPLLHCTTDELPAAVDERNLGVVFAGSNQSNVVNADQLCPPTRGHRHKARSGRRD